MLDWLKEHWPEILVGLLGLLANEFGWIKLPEGITPEQVVAALVLLVSIIVGNVAKRAARRYLA